MQITGGRNDFLPPVAVPYHFSEYPPVPGNIVYRNGRLVAMEWNFGKIMLAMIVGVLILLAIFCRFFLF